MAQMTNRERKLVQTVRLKFALINITYYICWIPNIINGILLWTLWFELPVKLIITLWFIMVRSLQLTICIFLIVKIEIKIKIQIKIQIQIKNRN